MQRFLIIAGLSPPFLVMLGLALYGPATTEAIVALIAIVGAGAFFWPWSWGRQIEPTTTPLVSPPPAVSIPDDTLDLAAARIAIAASTHAAVAKCVAPVPAAKAEQARALLQTLLDAEEAWVFASLESTPRRPEAQIQAAATRLMEDARERFPAPPATDPLSSGDDPFRSASESAVFVVSLVMTSRHNIKGHRAESKQQTRALLRHLRDLADDVHTLDVSVSGFLSVDELAQRDPAMQGIA